LYSKIFESIDLHNEDKIPNKFTHELKELKMRKPLKSILKIEQSKPVKKFIDNYLGLEFLNA
jgi:hypothetical protein